MKKILLLSVDGIYGSGSLAVWLISRLKEEFSSMGYLVKEHATPDVPRALLQGAVAVAEDPRVGNSFWADYQTELLTKARVCDKINDEMQNCPLDKKGVIIICKNFQGSLVHGRLHNPEWEDAGMGEMEHRARCGVEFRSEVVPDLTFFLDIEEESAARVCADNMGELLRNVEDQDVRDKVSKIFNDLDLFLQRTIYKDLIAKLGSKGFIIDGKKSADEIEKEVISIIWKTLGR